jgi:hypothetical protein
MGLAAVLIWVRVGKERRFQPCNQETSDPLLRSGAYMTTKRYLKIAAILLLEDWALGAAQAGGLMPLWTFLAANFPFGAIYVWFESHWTGTQYRIGNQAVSELWPLLCFFPIVLAQAWLYCLLFGLWHTQEA